MTCIDSLSALLPLPSKKREEEFSLRDYNMWISWQKNNPSFQRRGKAARSEKAVSVREGQELHTVLYRCAEF